MKKSQIIYQKTKSPPKKRQYKSERLKTFEPATPEQLKDIPLKVPLIPRDLAICEALLFYRAMKEGMIERLLFWEPGVTFTKAPERLFKLYHHRFVDRLKIDGEIVYVLLAGGRDEIARQRGVDTKTLDWNQDHNRRADQHWAHLSGSNEVRIRIFLAIESLQSLYILDHAPLDPEIRDTAKQLIEAGWSRSRVWEKIDYLTYIRQGLKQPLAHPGAWLRQAVEENYHQPTDFMAKEFVSPLSAVNDAEEGWRFWDWLTDRDFNRLKANQKLGVEYTLPNSRQQLTGVVEPDDEFEIITPWMDKGKRKSFVLMGEYDNLTRTLEATTPPKRDQDDPSFRNKMAKFVAMLNNGVYTKVRGRKLDKIFIVCNGGPRAVENRLKVIRSCGGENAFFVVSLEVLKQLSNQTDILLVPLWRKPSDSQEKFYPLLGQTWLERLKQLLKQHRLSDAEIAEAETEIYQEAKRQFYRTVLAGLNKAQLERVRHEADRGRADKLLQSFYTQRWGQTAAQTLAIFADRVARQRYEEQLKKLRDQEGTQTKEKAR